MKLSRQAIFTYTMEFTEDQRQMMEAMAMEAQKYTAIGSIAVFTESFIQLLKCES
jgi:hypothetical protein